MIRYVYNDFEMVVIIPRDVKMSRSVLVNMLIKDKNTMIENIIDTSRFSVLFVLRISEELSGELGLRELDVSDIRNVDRPYLSRLIMKVSFLSNGLLRYRSYNQKLEKVASDIESYKNEVLIQKDIFEKSLCYGKIITPQVLYNRIYYDEYVNGKFKNEVDIFDVLSKRKQRFGAYSRLYSYYTKQLNTFKRYAKASLFRYSVFKGLGVMLMSYSGGYSALSDLVGKIPDRVRLKEVVTKQFYMLKSYSYIHNDTHAGNYLWNSERGYGLIIDFGKSYKGDGLVGMDMRSYILKFMGEDVLDEMGNLVSNDCDEYIGCLVSCDDLGGILGGYEFF